MSHRTAAKLIAALAALTALGAAAPAQGAGLGAVVAYSDPGDFVGDGRDRLLFPGRASIGARPIENAVEVSGTTKAGERLQLTFDAPEGKKLKRGVYDHAQRYPFQETDRPGISVSGFGRGCNETTGRFEIKDLDMSRRRVKELWIVYEQHCEGGSAAIWGEVRIGRNDHGGPALVDPAIVRWPVPAEGGGRKDVPVTIRARRRVKIRSAKVAGADPGDFPVQADGCSGRTLGAGKRCQVLVRFAPGAPGTRTAALRIEDSSSREHSVRLQGFKHGGRTRLVVNSEPGDRAGDGRSREYTPADTVFAVVGSPRSLSFTTQTGDPFGEGPSESWRGRFALAEGERLAPGRYGPAADSGPYPHMELSGPGRCSPGSVGEFTVREATHTSQGDPRGFALDFEQRCQDAQARLTGVFEWRAGDTAGLAPWMRP